MEAPKRRAVASAAVLIFLAFYVWAVIEIGGGIPDHPLAQLLFYGIAGTAWGLPLIPVLIWAKGGAGPVQASPIAAPIAAADDPMPLVTEVSAPEYAPAPPVVVLSDEPGHPLNPNVQSMMESVRYWQQRHFTGGVPDYEEILADSYARFLKPGDTIIDIGVNHGVHLVQFLEIAGPTGRVIGFEPVPAFIEFARSVCGDAVEIRPMAVSDQPGQAEFLFMTKAPGESGFKERTSPGDRGAEPIQVQVSTLDIELSDLARLDYIKIDTEGHEISILNGGLNVIRRHRPIISVEYGSPGYTLYGHTAVSLYDLAASLNYVISDLFGNIVKDVEEWLQACDAAFWDYYLVPAERADGWQAQISPLGDAAKGL